MADEKAKKQARDSECGFHFQHDFKGTRCEAAISAGGTKAIFIKRTLMNIDKNNFWGSNYYNHPALSDIMILEAEKMLGVKMPNGLIELLRIQNGGYTKGFAFPMTQKTTWAENHVPLPELFGIVTDKSIKTAQNIMDTVYMTEEWGLPPKQVLLMGDGHYWITLDYRKSEVPSVRWIDVECDEDIHIAHSFEEFINGLVSDEAFAK